MQAASSNSEIVLDPSTAHLTDPMRAAHAHVFVTSGDSSGREGKEEVKGSKWSWLQRLKPRDDMELSRGAATEVALETSKTEKGCAPSERLEVGVRSVQPDCVSQILLSRPRPNWHAETSSAAKRQKTIEEKNYGEAERQRSDIVQEKFLKSELGRIDATPVEALPTNVGFGPWVNLSFGRRSDTKRIAVISKIVVDAAMSGPEVCREVQGNSHSSLNALPKCSIGIMQGEATIPPTLFKPPLSPKPIKLGLPPRPPNQKISGFHSPSKVASLASGPSRGVFHQLPIENPPNGQILVTHSKGLPDYREQFSPLSPTGMGNGGMSSKMQPRPIVIERRNAGVGLGEHRGSSPDVAMGRTLEDGSRVSVCANVLSNIAGMDLHPKFVDIGTEISKTSSKNGSMLQAASLEPTKSPTASSPCGTVREVSLEPTKSTLQQSPTASSPRGTTRVVEKVANASSSATLPWEMFIEPAGASKKAREQFVEVYNRARDELRNQRLLQNMSRAPGRELDGGPKLTLGPSGATSDVRVERQSMRHGQQSLGHVQFQGRNLKLEHQILPYISSLKETITAESRQYNQAEGFGQVQPLREGLSQKTVVQEGIAEIPMQRTGEGSVHSKELRSGDKEGQILSNNVVCNQKELISKYDNDIKCTGLGQGSREQKQNNVQEAVPVLCNQPCVNFEDHSISLLAEKGAASNVRPQSKSHLWLQRWHSTSKNNPNDLPADAPVTYDGKKSDSHSHQSRGLKKFGDGDGIGVFGQANVSGERVESWKTSPSKVVPSAAAMAIVGTAARQFYSSQPQGKGSFAFWSGFGASTYRKAEPAQEKEKDKDKVFLTANTNFPSC